MQQALNFLKEYIQKTNPLLEKILEEEREIAKKEGKAIAECLKYLKKLSFKGKRLRGALTVLGYMLSGKRPVKKIFIASLALEIFHTSVLIHDDILDKDEVRRGEKTAHIFFKNFAEKKLSENDPYHYGISQAITLGDYGYFLSLKTFLTSGFEKEILLEAEKLFIKSLLKVVKGQMLDITHLPLEKIKEEEILKIIQYKTAEYTGVLPLKLGIILSGEKSEEKLQAAQDYGNYLGWVFQIRDDILGIYGDPQKTGKPILSDIKEGKNTLFIYFIAKYGRKKEKEFLQNFFDKKFLNENDAREIQNFFRKTGALDFVQEKLKEYKSKALKICRQLTEDPRLESLLKSFVILAAEREK